jgi:phage baseplate assembly protein W
MSKFSQSTNTNYDLSVLGENLPKNYKPTGFFSKAPTFYSDINTNYMQNSSVLILSGKSAIDNKISNILTTPLGSDPFEPLFGSLLPFRLHDHINSVTAELIKQDSIDALDRWMFNTITVYRNQANVTPLSSEEGYHIYIPFSYEDIGTIQNFEAKVYR